MRPSDLSDVLRQRRSRTASDKRSGPQYAQRTPSGEFKSIHREVDMSPDKGGTNVLTASAIERHDQVQIEQTRPEDGSGHLSPDDVGAPAHQQLPMVTIAFEE